MSQRRKPTISIIGAGRLGQALALALQESGYPVMALVARRRQKAEKAAATQAKNKRRPAALAATELADLPDTDVVLISTPDDAIAGVAVELAKLQRGKRRRVVLHTSGALSSEVLAPLAPSGFQTGSLHPLASISETLSGARSLHGAFFCVEGTAKAKAVGKAIVRDLGGRSFTIKPEHKTLYHAAALTASPQLTALFDVAVELLAACGLSKRQAQEVFMPLLESTVNNLRTATPQQALTGTFARGDIETVRRHLKALSGKGHADVLEIYKLLGKHSLKLAQKNGLDPNRVAEILRLLR
ncbi:MAG TPA: Rossmann-like and DUF2520 domain-containing protein [Pyrinomonadaceae bacterium]|nr:Rossmann-like and DUF2520 domain-containing protein [Pyrinomonadaceae bacterium]